jgi:hypothetical protein
MCNMKTIQKQFVLALGIVGLLVLPAVVQSGDSIRTTHRDPVQANGLLLAGSGSLVVTGSQTPADAPEAPPVETPEFFVASPMHYFGRVLDGTEVAHDFLIENRGGSDLAIDKVLTG